MAELYCAFYIGFQTSLFSHPTRGPERGDGVTGAGTFRVGRVLGCLVALQKLMHDAS
jgi:hypothetical protein